MRLKWLSPALVPLKQIDPLTTGLNKNFKPDENTDIIFITILRCKTGGNRAQSLHRSLENHAVRFSVY